MSTLEMPSDEQNTFAFHQYPCCSFLLKLYNCTSFFWTTFLFPFSSVFLLLATVPLTILYHYSKALASKDGWMDGWEGRFFLFMLRPLLDSCSHCSAVSQQERNVMCFDLLFSISHPLLLILSKYRLAL